MTGPAARRADAVLFDKDGTLFDFDATWNVWAGQAIADLARGDAEAERRLADVVDYDAVARRFRPTSQMIAGTNREAAESMAQALPGRAVDEIEHFLMVSSADAPLVPAVPLVPFLQGLGASGLSLGVVTNDTEYGARAHLASAGVSGHFDFVAGYDSGHGAKPAPGPLLAFARAVGATPARVVMVGDSTHDLIAGRAAGMWCVGVLTGIAGRDDLQPYADVILPDIGHLPGWLEA